MVSSKLGTHRQPGLNAVRHEIKPRLVKKRKRLVGGGWGMNMVGGIWGDRAE